MSGELVRMQPRAGVVGLGDRVLGFVEHLGEFTRLTGRAVRALRRGRYPWRETVTQFQAVAIGSTTIVGITALFTGMVLALQTVSSLARFGAKPYTGSFVGLAIALELGPVLTAIMVSGRVGAGIAAELGSMAVTEQIDAIRAMGADPVQKLVLPRVVATSLALPMLTVFAIALGVLGGMVIASQSGIAPNFYLTTVFTAVTVRDFVSGVSKTFFFGWAIGMVACYAGLSTTGGTVGVGRATTRAVVSASICVFVSDFFLTKLILML